MKKITNRYILEARRKRIKKRLFITLIFLIVIGIVVINKTDVCIIDKVMLEGDNLITGKYVQEKAETLKGLNIIYIDKESIIKDFKRNPYVEELTIKRVYPNKLKINVKEAKGLYYVNKDESYYIISSNMILLEEVDSIEDKKLIELRGIDIENLSLGDKVSKQKKIEKIAEDFYDMEQVIEENGEEFSITAVDLSNMSNLKAYIGNIEIFLGTYENVFKKMSDAVQIYKNFDVTESINVSFDGSPDFK
ncbi:MAG: FtsQ-type POTRA domain-containing protein [Clostridium sp.]|nr:FtsQ-type POTRA domain-containing protein [Clostridium sp.]